MSDAPRRLPPKKEVAVALLEGPSLFVHLDPRRPGVVVPKWFMNQPQLVLQVGLNMAIRIPDLTVDDSGVTCTLSFKGSPFWCHMPWASVYALVGEDGKGMIWPNDVPPEVSLQGGATSKGAPAVKPAAKKPRSKLSAVDGRPPGRDSRSSDARAKDDSSHVQVGGQVGGPDRGSKDDAAPSAPRGVPNRPRPSAVPVPVPALAPAPALSGAHADRDGEAGSPPPPNGANAGRKPRRELPPYLRVVK